MSILILLLAVTLWSVVHSWLASTRVRDRAQQRFGEAARRGYRLFYNLFASLTFFPIVLLMAYLPDRPFYAIPGIWGLLALLIQGIALILLAVGFLQTGPLAFLGLQQLLESEPSPSKLVTTGLYRIVRHPLYAAGLLFLWFNPQMSTNTFTVFAALTVYLFAGAHFEEIKMVREFGLEYIAYQQATPMILPGLRFAGMRAKMRKLL